MDLEECANYLDYIYMKVLADTTVFISHVGHLHHGQVSSRSCKKCIVQYFIYYEQPRSDE